MKFLIVDDNANARRMIKRYLSTQANEFRECDDGDGAVSAYADFRPDWVLMDWEMKRVNGLSAMLLLREEFPDAKVLMVTNYDDDDLRRAAAEAGAVGFIPKDDLILLQSFLE
jgi:DNA-binding NarL/FixJ family response regulator